jgi:hypothetical protein
MTTHRLVEILVGTAVIGYCANSIYTGHAFGRIRSYSRAQHPWTFWAIVVIGIASGVAFLLGDVTWRA